MFKKSVLTAILILLSLMIFPVPAVRAEEDISVLINNQPLSLEVPPQVENGRTLVPLRAIFEALGASVEWNEADQSITATKGTQVLKLVVGSSTAFNNGSSVQLDIPPQIINERTLVPLRFVSENMGAQVVWNETTHQVSIVSSGISNSPTVSGNKISPTRIDGIVKNAHTQFRQLTRVDKLSPAAALSQQIAALKLQPDVDLVEQLPDTTDLKVRFKDGYELVMLQGEVETRGGAMPSAADLAPEKKTIVPTGLDILKKTGVNIEDILLDPSQQYQTPSPHAFRALIFDTTYDNPAQMQGLDEEISLKLKNAGYTVDMWKGGNLKGASIMDDWSFALVYISSHGTVVDGEFYFTVRPYYYSPPPADSGYQGTKVFSVYTGDGDKTAYVYAVGSKFAQTYWTNKFPGTIFLLSVCHSAQSPGIGSLPTWTLNHGASTWLGWTGSVSFKNSDKGSQEFFNQMTQWKTVDETRVKVNSVIYSKPPEMFLLLPSMQNANVTLPRWAYDAQEDQYPYGQDFYNFGVEKYNGDAYLTFYTVTNSAVFNLYLDNNGDGKTDISLKFTPGNYEVYSVAGSGQTTLKELGKTYVNNVLQYKAIIPWSTLFGSGSINRYRLAEGTNGSGDIMPDNGWLVAADGSIVTTPDAPTGLTTSTGGVGGEDRDAAGGTTSGSTSTAGPFAGIWKTTSDYQIYFVQNGSSVYGVWGDRLVITGTADGNTFNGTWTGGLNNNPDDKITLTLSADGQSFNGTYRAGSIPNRPLSGTRDNTASARMIATPTVGAPTANFTGTWGDIILTQTGSQISGTWGTGGNAKTVSGTVNGNVINGRYYKTSFPALFWDFSVTMNPDGKGFKGYQSLQGGAVLQAVKK
ncbi:MAG TPA: copper amine oxidase N-terminal domain-containing protein [Syntrophomonadaceae bacterium]|nr:copper amine oxidase N-terminal domain-containing protein [Syntrophomonadaceae bacterium]